MPSEGQWVTPEHFHFDLDRRAYRAAARRDGAHLRRTTMAGDDPRTLWERYFVLTEIAVAFKCLKSDLAVRPICHQLEDRVDGHIFVAFLAYCLMTTLRYLLR